MNTKERILDTALALFNTQGIDSITVRHIAQEMGISHGNLQYHYPNTNEIINALYGRLAAALDAIMLNIPHEGPEMLVRIRQSVESAYHLIYEYRFIFLHFVEVCRRIPGVRKDYNGLIKRREQQFLAMIDLLKATGLFRKNTPEAACRHLVSQMVIITDFWLSSNEITLHLKGGKAVAHYCEVFWALFYPYLTPKGVRQFS